MQTEHFNLLLADDDEDDCLFFQEALKELPLSASLSIVNDGVELMSYLNKVQAIPDIVYLDLNMPLKNGFDCLSAIKSNQKFKNLPIVIISTSLDKQIADQLYDTGAQCYIRKPAEFRILKTVISRSIELITEFKDGQVPKDKFIISY